MSKNIKRTVTFSPSQWKLIKSEAEERGLSESGTIRFILAEARPEFNAPDRRIIGRMPKVSG